ncbi:MAG: tyrosine--tRNA ligase [Candidatus Paceibacterota bacterium]
MEKSTDDMAKIEELLTRGVDKVFDLENLKQKLQKGEKLRIKLGIDPTSPNIHIGRSIPILKLRDFQELGHQIVFIIGDFTGVIGDTSDKDSERPMLTTDTVTENMQRYIEQAGKILDIDKCEIYYNSKWLKDLSYAELCTQADVFSLGDFIKRENIKKRLDGGKRVSLRELMYPLMQGYDSVAIKADVELGGTDQWFNLLAGRDLQRHYGQAPQDIITNPLIEGLDGRKMSSSWGNTVNLFDEPNDMYGKIMSLRDEFIIKYMQFCTRLPLSEISEYEQQLSSGINPRDIKMYLAFELVRMYYSEESAVSAQEYFITTFTKKETPTEVPKFKAGSLMVLDVLCDSDLVSSKSEARRLVGEGAVKLDHEVVTDVHKVAKPGQILQKGKIHFIEITE